MTGDNTNDNEITIRVPTELPVLTEPVSRILLAILVELTTVEILDGPSERKPRDC